MQHVHALLSERLADEVVVRLNSGRAVSELAWIVFGEFDQVLERLSEWAAFTATQLTELMTVAIGVRSLSGSTVARFVRNLVHTRSLPTAYINV